MMSLCLLLISGGFPLAFEFEKRKIKRMTHKFMNMPQLSGLSILTFFKMRLIKLDIGRSVADTILT